MLIQRSELEEYLNQVFKPQSYDDYGPNGLQIEGNHEIRKITFAVSATKESIEQTIKLGAEALVVHHGLFWKFHGPRPITGPFGRRVSALIKHEINLFAYHLPLDGHPELGNAASLAQLIGLNNLKPFGEGKMRGSYTGVKGEINLTTSELKTKLEKILNHPVMVSSPEANRPLRSLGIITGGANSEWRLAQKEGLDAYLTGEMSEHDWHEAKEAGITMFAGGHHATEQFGIQSLMNHLQEKFNCECVYLESTNPA